MAPRVAATPGRSVVLSLSPVHPRLANEMRARNLEVTNVASVSHIAGAMSTGLRAVFIGYGPQLRRDLLAVCDDVLNSGALLGVLLTDPTAAAAHRVAALAVVKSVLDSDFQLVVDEGVVRIFQEWEPAAVAEACARHDPGRAHDSDLAVHLGTPPAVLPAVERLLLHRAFAGYRHVKVSKLAGGFTGSRLLAVQATDTLSRDCAPYVVKIGPHQEIRKEIDTTRAFVADLIPFPNHPAIVHDRCIVGARKRALVSRLVDQADRLDDFIAGANSKREVEHSIALIFEGALRHWRNQGQSRTMPLIAHYREPDVKAIPDPRRLIAAYNEARRDDPTIGPPDELIRKAEHAAGSQYVRLCLAHGDLHVRNVFARRHPPGSRRLTDIVLIDFASAGIESPAARDLATLDVSLALDDLSGCASLGFSEAAQLYPADILKVRALPNRGRRDVAIRAVRSHAVRELVSREEYLASLFAYFARYAKFVRAQGCARCAIAYRLAWQVVRNL